MPLSARTRLGPYEILEPMGTGGMGEVWKARDTRLDRTVAIKVLAAELSRDPQHRERLVREARAVSGLNHPHICTLHDIGTQEGIDYLVLEYLDGQTLQQRLRDGPLPPDEALCRAIEIAGAIDRAHRNGVVHRDLKPANIMLTKSGAKVLDFGLAKTAAGVRSASADETLTNALTSPGIVVGTLQYMAPEQLEGKEAGPRSDIFAFGAVLYEMLTGRRAFAGDSPAGLVASILTADPPAAPEITPNSSLDRVVRKCLAKDQDRRWQTAADLKDELEWITSGSRAVLLPAKPARSSAAPWVAAMLALALLAGGLVWSNGSAPADQSVWNFPIPPPRDAVFAFTETGGMAISPNGQMLAFPATTSKGSQLWIRDLRSGSEKPLPGTDGARGPFWSPDSRFIGFFAAGKLKKIGLSGAPEVICNAGEARGGSWNRDGVIIFTPRSLSVVYRVSASGGEPVQITTFDPENHQNAHYWPHFLPDGRHFLYWGRNTGDFRNSGIFVGSIDDDPGLTGRPLLVATTAGSVYSPGPSGDEGHLLFLRGNALVAQTFDPSRMRLSGEPVRVVEEIAAATGNALTFISVSTGGVLVYAAPESQISRLSWKTRQGVTSGQVAPPAAYQDVRLSRDGRNIAVIREDEATGQNVWSIAPGGGITRLSLSTSLARSTPVWSPDGMRVAYSQPAQRAITLFTVPFSGSAQPQQLSVTTTNQYAEDWTPDGRYLLYRQASPTTQYDLWALPLQPGADALPLINAPPQEVYGRISPDGRWIAYCSDDSGVFEVYVQSFAALIAGGKTSPRWTVSTSGGLEPAWRRDGKELFYRAPNGAIMSTDVEASAGSFRTGTPKFLFEAPKGSFRIYRTSYDVSPDGARFIMIEPVTLPGSSPLQVLTDWRAGVVR